MFILFNSDFRVPLRTTPDGIHAIDYADDTDGTDGTLAMIVMISMIAMIRMMPSCLLFTNGHARRKTRKTPLKNRNLATCNHNNLSTE